MGIHGLGRKSASEKYDDPRDYLNEHIYPIFDGLEEFKKELVKAEVKYNAAKNKVKFQQSRLDNAYLGLQKWRK